jgi:hypothetical protein
MEKTEIYMDISEVGQATWKRKAPAPGHYLDPRRNASGDMPVSRWKMRLK